MRRRTALGIAAGALLTGGCGETQRRPAVAGARVRTPIGHDAAKGNNYNWSSPVNRARAQMLALTMLICNGNKAKDPTGKDQAYGFYKEFRDNGANYQQSLLKNMPNHPFVSITTPQLYQQTWNYCNGTLGWDAAADKLRAASQILLEFANAGLAPPQDAKNAKGIKFDTYNGPDECPCFGAPDPSNPDCEIVDPLL